LITSKTAIHFPIADDDEWTHKLAKN